MSIYDQAPKPPNDGAMEQQNAKKLLLLVVSTAIFQFDITEVMLFNVPFHFVFS